MIPIYNFEKKQSSDMSVSLFRNEYEPDYEKIHIVKKALQTLLQPLYNKEDNYVSKCVRIDEKMELLTPQEKKIVKTF